MVPIKLEDHIREQLQEREIQPSNNSWKKLQQQIKVTPKKKNNKRWFYLAASIVGIVIISTLMKSEPQFITEPSNEIVDVNHSLNEIESADNLKVVVEETKNKTLVSSHQEELTVHQPKVLESKKEPVATKTIVEPNSLKINSIETPIVASNSIMENDINKEEEFISFKVEEVVAQIKNSSKAITDEEINTLLLKAQQEIHSKRLIVNNKVDAMELLSLVEDELEETFRDRVFEALGDGYKKVRTAVVNREY